MRRLRCGRGVGGIGGCGRGGSAQAADEARPHHVIIALIEIIKPTTGETSHAPAGEHAFAGLADNQALVILKINAGMGIDHRGHGAAAVHDHAASVQERDCIHCRYGH